MSKLIRFDEDHFGFLVDTASLDMEYAKQFSDTFAAGWPGKRLIVMAADEFIDLTGQYEIVPIGDPVAA